MAADNGLNPTTLKIWADSVRGSSKSPECSWPSIAVPNSVMIQLVSAEKRRSIRNGEKTWSSPANHCGMPVIVCVFGLECELKVIP